MLSTILKSQQGYSLIELLVVFSLLALISGIGFAGFSEYSYRQVVDQASSDVQAAFEKAKENAISQVKPEICGNTNPLYGYKVNLDVDGSYEIVADCGDLVTPSPEQMQLPQNVTFSNVACSGIEYKTLTNTVDIPSGCSSFDIGYRSDLNTKKTLTVDNTGTVSVSP